MKNWLQDLIKDNLWAILMGIVALIAWQALTNYRVNAMEAELAEYPSRDYFNLKFETLDKGIDTLNIKLDKHIEGAQKE